MSVAVDRLSSGNPRLDAVLGGGFPANAINLVIGLPGTGKTILAQQYVYANATSEQPALYLSTVSEPFEKIIRYGQTLDFFDARAVGTSVFYEDLGGALVEHGLGGALETTRELLKERRPALLVIDSFKALTAYADSQRDLRGFIHELAGSLSALPLTCFWVGEYDADELAVAPEFAVADAIVSLRIARVAEREARSLQVLKLRGSAFASGSHAYRISTAGVDVFPRLADVGDQTSYELGSKRVPSGIPVLDEMLADGYYPGSATLIAGPSGIGKTVMGLRFISHGARNGESGIIATIAENPSQLERTAAGFGWSLRENGIEVMYRSPVDLYIDEWVYELLGAIERTGARRVLIDSLSDLDFATRDAVRFREYVYSLTHRCSRTGVSLLMTSEIPDLFRVQSLSKVGISEIAENVVLLQYVRGSNALRRSVTVLKTRATGHDAHIREFEITRDGIVLGEHLPGGASPATKRPRDK